MTCPGTRCRSPRAGAARAAFGGDACAVPAGKPVHRKRNGWWWRPLSWEANAGWLTWLCWPGSVIRCLRRFRRRSSSGCCWSGRRPGGRCCAFAHRPMLRSAVYRDIGADRRASLHLAGGRAHHRACPALAHRVAAARRHGLYAGRGTGPPRRKLTGRGGPGCRGRRAPPGRGPGRRHGPARPAVGRRSRTAPQPPVTWHGRTVIFDETHEPCPVGDSAAWCSGAACHCDGPITTRRSRWLAEAWGMLAAPAGPGSRRRGGGGLC